MKGLNRDSSLSLRMTNPFMNISWCGQSCFEIVFKNKQGGETTVATDPFSPELGLKLPKIKADILLVSHNHSDHNNIKAIEGAPFVVDSAGEYEVKDVFVQTISGFHDNTLGKERGEIIMFKIEGEGLRVCHLSDLGQKELSPEQLEQIGEVDILLIPVGGKYTIDAKDAAEIVSQIEPRVVIPMHYKINNLKVDIEEVGRFLKIMGAENITPEKKFKVITKNLPTDETKIIILEP